jgi:23S rRNA pseudouridine2604 synthase
VDILDTRTKPCKVRRIGRNVFGIILTQGLNRQIRRMCAAFDYNVRRLQRVRIVNIRLDGIKTGQWRDLTASELRGLLPHRTQW